MKPRTYDLVVSCLLGFRVPSPNPADDVLPSPAVCKPPPSDQTPNPHATPSTMARHPCLQTPLPSPPSTTLALPPLRRNTHSAAGQRHPAATKVRPNTPNSMATATRRLNPIALTTHRSPLSLGPPLRTRHPPVSPRPRPQPKPPLTLPPPHPPPRPPPATRCQLALANSMPLALACTKTDSSSSSPVQPHHGTRLQPQYDTSTSHAKTEAPNFSGGSPSTTNTSHRSAPPPSLHPPPVIHLPPPSPKRSRWEAASDTTPPYCPRRRSREEYRSRHPDGSHPRDRRTATRDRTRSPRRRETGSSGRRTRPPPSPEPRTNNKASKDSALNQE